jgi:hypothetical protein
MTGTPQAGEKRIKSELMNRNKITIILLSITAVASALVAPQLRALPIESSSAGDPNRDLGTSPFTTGNPWTLPDEWYVYGCAVSSGWTPDILAPSGTGGMATGGDAIPEVGAIMSTTAGVSYIVRVTDSDHWVVDRCPKKSLSPTQPHSWSEEEVWRDSPQSLVIHCAGRDETLYSIYHPPTPLVSPWNIGGGAGTDRLLVGQKLLPGQYIQSANGLAMLMMQASDGNLVELVRPSASSTAWQTVWNAHTEGHAGAYAVLQKNSDFVVCTSSNVPIWDSATNGWGPVVMEINNNCTLGMYNYYNRHIWTAPATAPQSLDSGAGWGRFKQMAPAKRPAPLEALS